MEAIQMVDLKGQYLRIKSQVDEGIMEVLTDTMPIRLILRPKSLKGL